MYYDEYQNQNETSVSVSGRSGGRNSSKRECPGREGARVIFAALVLTLYNYSSWRVGRVVPMIRSAVQTTLRSILRSDLVPSWSRQRKYAFSHPILILCAML